VRRVFATPTRWYRGLGGDVVDDPVDAAYLVDDAVRDPAEELHVEVEEVGGHAVDRGDRAQRAHVLVGAGIAHDPDRAHRQQHRERLPDGVVQARQADLIKQMASPRNSTPRA
jgi:hypothetical protein